VSKRDRERKGRKRKPERETYNPTPFSGRWSLLRTGGSY